MKVVAYHLTGNANVKAALSGFYNADLLHEFHVTIASFENSLLDSMGAWAPFSEIRRRRFDPTLKPYIKTWPWFELGRLMAPRLGLKKLSSKKTSPFFVDQVVQKQDRRVAAHLKKAARAGATSVYAYEDCCIHSFREAKRLGLQCLYDLPIGYWRSARRLLEAEKERWPAWAATLEALREPEEKLARKEEEIRLADRIFVASSFTASTLKEFPGFTAPVHVVPYGFPEVAADLTRTRSYYKGNRPLKLLFVGSLSQRKGIADIFAAVENLKGHVELTLVGARPARACKALDHALARHTWMPSLAHHEILALMRQQDVLLFPSLFEGFGLVITEAMSQGTPVITTDRTAGPDLIEHNSNGWLIDAGSTEALQAAIEQILLHPQVVAANGRQALAAARVRPWRKYGEELANAVSQSSLRSPSKLVQ